MESFAATRSATLRVVMEIDFSEFLASRKQEFIADLAEVLGCPDQDLNTTTFRPGCVVSESRLGEGAIRLLLELIEVNAEGTLTSASPEVRAFLAKYNIKNINADLSTDLQIVVQQRPKQQLVFVHGWRSDSQTFGKLPDYLNEMFDSHVEPFAYPTSAFGHSPSIFHLARGLENHIRTHVSAERVGIIAHSMGGLIVRKLLVMQRDRKAPLDEAIRQATFVASPQLGSDLAKILKRVPGFSSEQLNELSPNSGFVIELHEQWQNWKDRKTPVVCEVRCVYGTNDDVVPAADASADDREAVPILGANHSNIVKPTSEKAEIVMTLARFLREAGFKSYERASGDTSTDQRPSL